MHDVIATTTTVLLLSYRYHEAPTSIYIRMEVVRHNIVQVYDKCRLILILYKLYAYTLTLYGLLISITKY